MPVRFGVALRSGAAMGSALASPGPETRRLTFSTTTALLRPWLKLWRTTPCSTPARLSVSVLAGATLSLSLLFLVVSDIPIQFRSHERLRTNNYHRLSWPRPGSSRLSHPGPDRRSETVPSAANAPKTCHSGPRRAGLHVSHLTVPVPNPIAPRSGFESQRPYRPVVR